MSRGYKLRTFDVPARVHKMRLSTRGGDIYYQIKYLGAVWLQYRSEAVYVLVIIITYELYVFYQVIIVIKVY